MVVAIIKFLCFIINNYVLCSKVVGHCQVSFCLKFRYKGLNLIFVFCYQCNLQVICLGTVYSEHHRVWLASDKGKAQLVSLQKLKYSSLPEFASDFCKEIHWILPSGFICKINLGSNVIVKITFRNVIKITYYRNLLINQKKIF